MTAGWRNYEGNIGNDEKDARRTTDTAEGEGLIQGRTKSHKAGTNSLQGCCLAIPSSLLSLLSSLSQTTSTTAAGLLASAALVSLYPTRLQHRCTSPGRHSCPPGYTLIFASNTACSNTASTITVLISIFNL